MQNIQVIVILFDTGPICEIILGKSGFLYIYSLDSDINVQLNSFVPFMHLAGVLIFSLTKWEQFELKRGEGNYNSKKPHANFLNET